MKIVIRQTQLYDQTQKLLAREQLINQITSHTRQSFDLETILTEAIAQLLEALEVDRCLVHLVEDAGDLKQHRHQQVVGYCETAHRTTYRRQHLYEVCREPFPPSIHDFDLQGPITQWVISHRQTVVIPDVNQDSRIGTDNQEYQKAQIKSSLVVPVQTKDKLHAILYLNQCSQIRYWSKIDQELAQSVANQLAISVQQACLFAQIRAAMERESLLRLMGEQIRSTLDLKTILQTAVREVRQLLDTDRVAVYQFISKQKCEVAVEEVTDTSFSLRGKIERDDCLLQEFTDLYQGRQSEVINNVFTTDLSDCYRAFLDRLQVQASIVVPIFIGKHLWGLLIVHECNQVRVWQESEVDLLNHLVTQVAIAIQQAELYQQAQKAALTAQTKAEALEQALSKLQQTQSQLIQTEKMSSLGQLVAGVAHEINNPINFIFGNLSFADKYTQDLISLMHLYELYYPNPAPEIQEFQTAIDLDFISQDFTKILDSMKAGAERISQIVLSLQNFSRLDQAEMKPVDIHEGIDSTLLILQNRLKAKEGIPPINVIKDYGNLPLVECFAGQLNQVFMNILSNSIDALEESSQQDSFPVPTIWITTSANHQAAVIRIADNGTGMTEEVLNRLFDPFFTTKPVGKGTGLGLSISYQVVVEKHGGFLNCVSVPGQGTEFWIKIPLQQNQGQSKLETPVKALNEGT